MDTKVRIKYDKAIGTKKMPDFYNSISKTITYC